jgi:hypothetical protein
MATETVTITLETEEDSDEIEVPVGAVDLLSEGEEGPSAVAGDLALLGVAQQLHGVVHHTHGEVDEDIEAAEQKALDLFEERFGRSFADMTGHDH